MKRRLILASIILTMILGSSAFGQEEQWLSYRSSADTYQETGGTSSRQIEVSAGPPAGLTCPKFVGQPIFARWTSPLAKSGGVWMAIDKSSSTSHYNRIYIDSNADGSLADEKPLPAREAQQYSSEFGPVKVLLEGEDGPVAYHLNVHIYAYRQPYQVFAASAGWYMGKITLGGKPYECRLVDYNGNGVFNDVSSDFAQLDRIILTPILPADTATPARSVPDEREMYFMGKFLEVGDVYYRPEPARDGAFIKLTPLKDVKVGQVRVPKEVTQIKAGGENGLIVVRPRDGLGRLPVGDYKLFDWQADRKVNNVPWRLRGSQIGDQGKFQVAEGKEASVNIGEPVTVSLVINERKNEFSFDLKLTGRLGESIEMTSNGNRSDAPKLRITNSDGTYNKTLNFEYG